jgi:tRNA threonylcarbamoyladenosine biosynthesis protein TsaE
LLFIYFATETRKEGERNDRINNYLFLCFRVSVAYHKATFKKNAHFTNSAKYLCNMEVNFSLEEINDVAKKVIDAMANKKVIALHGQMGAGKTTFTHAFCDALGVVDVVSSPTFSIINQYQTKQGETIYHLDLYRLKDEEEAINAGVEDCLYSDNICLIEWPERIPTIFPENTFHIIIEVIDLNRRKIAF